MIGTIATVLGKDLEPGKAGSVKWSGVEMKAILEKNEKGAVLLGQSVLL